MNAGRVKLPSNSVGRLPGRSPLPEGYSWSEWEAEVGGAASLPKGRIPYAPLQGVGTAQRRSKQASDRLSGELHTINIAFLLFFRLPKALLAMFRKACLPDRYALEVTACRLP